MTISAKRVIILATVLALLLSACDRSITRNGDGTANVETSITQQELQDAISTSIADPLIKGLTVSLQPGYILVSGTRERLNDASKTDTLSFRLDLGMSNGQLTSTISNAQFDGFTVEQNRIEHWNTTIANRIEKIAQKHPNSTLKSVSITPSAVTMMWTVKK
jgi:hypothetical protein